MMCSERTHTESSITHMQPQGLVLACYTYYLLASRAGPLTHAEKCSLPDPEGVSKAGAQAESEPGKHGQTGVGGSEMNQPLCVKDPLILIALKGPTTASQPGGPSSDSCMDVSIGDAPHMSREKGCQGPQLAL